MSHACRKLSGLQQMCVRAIPNRLAVHNYMSDIFSC